MPLCSDGVKPLVWIAVTHQCRFHVSHVIPTSLRVFLFCPYIVGSDHVKIRVRRVRQSSAPAGSAGLGAAGTALRRQLSHSPCPGHGQGPPGWLRSAWVSCNWELLVCLRTEWFSCVLEVVCLCSTTIFCLTKVHFYPKVQQYQQT